MKQPTKRPVRKGAILIASGSFTRPTDTTPYSSGDLVANSTTAGSVVPLSIQTSAGAGKMTVINRVRLTKSTTSVTTASFRIHLYGTSPTAANGDNAAFSTTTSVWMGSVDVTITQAFSDGAKVASAGYLGFVHDNPAGTNVIYALLECRSAYTPGNAEVFTLVIETSDTL